MPGRRVVVGLLLAAALGVGIAEMLGPFRGHPRLSYDEFRARAAAGSVNQVAQWQDRLEVTTGDGGTFIVVVPGGADPRRDAAGVRSFSVIPRGWAVLQTPVVPVALVLAGLLIWVPVVASGLRTPPEPTEPRAA